MSARLGLCWRWKAFCVLFAKRSAVKQPQSRATFCCSAEHAKRKVNGVELFYQRAGKGDHVVLLLPGALGSGETDFGPQFTGLDRERFTVVTWDPRGYGRSRPPQRDFPSHFFHRDAKDAVDLMQALNYEKFSLLGWSDGGTTAMIAAARTPSLINKMVIWGATAYVTEQDVEICNAVRNVSMWSENMRKPMEAMYGPQYFAQTWAAWVDGISQFAKRPDGDICRDLLPLISCPTLIVHGEKDPMVPAFHPRYLHQNIRGSRLHLMPEGKHNLHLRFSAEFNKLVEEFLCE